ncbi:hypothetical protein ACTXT7_003348 [Hymenolepis weldensis]
MAKILNNCSISIKFNLNVIRAKTRISNVDNCLRISLVPPKKYICTHVLARPQVTHIRLSLFSTQKRTHACQLPAPTLPICLLSLSAHSPLYPSLSLTRFNPLHGKSHCGQDFTIFPLRPQTAYFTLECICLSYKQPCTVATGRPSEVQNTTDPPQLLIWESLWCSEDQKARIKAFYDLLSVLDTSEMTNIFIDHFANFDELAPPKEYRQLFVKKWKEATNKQVYYIKHTL